MRPDLLSLKFEAFVDLCRLMNSRNNYRVVYGILEI